MTQRCSVSEFSQKIIFVEPIEIAKTSSLSWIIHWRRRRMASISARAVTFWSATVTVLPLLRASVTGVVAFAGGPAVPSGFRYVENFSAVRRQRHL